MILTKEEIKIALCCLGGVLIFFGVSLSIVFGINASAKDDKTVGASVQTEESTTELSQEGETSSEETTEEDIEYTTVEIKTPIRTANAEEKKEDAAAQKKKRGEVIKTDNTQKKPSESENKPTENGNKVTIGLSSYNQGWNIIGKEKYYIGENGFYTGINNIGGFKYRFDNDGKLTSYTCIDVSEWQGKINWSTVKNSGVDFAVIRCAWRGNSKGGLFLDSAFKTNIQQATSVGIPCGVYIFSQAVNADEGVEEASYVLNVIKGYKVSLPVIIDVEWSGGRGDKIDTATRTSAVKAFCETVKNAGYYPMIYASRDFLQNNLNMSKLPYDVWVAEYASSTKYSNYKMWQYTQCGRVNGIDGDVDLNICLTNYPEYIKNKGYNNL